MHIALAPFTLKEGVTEEELLEASDRFDRDFVSKQDGITKRLLVKDQEAGGYADVVFFRDLAAVEQVIEAEQSSEVCAAFFSVLDEDGAHRVFEVVKSYE